MKRKRFTPCDDDFFQEFSHFLGKPPFILLFTGFYTSQVVSLDFWTINSRLVNILSKFRDFLHASFISKRYTSTFFKWEVSILRVESMGGIRWEQLQKMPCIKKRYLCKITLPKTNTNHAPENRLFQPKKEWLFFISSIFKRAFALRFRKCRCLNKWMSRSKLYIFKGD